MLTKRMFWASVCVLSALAVYATALIYGRDISEFVNGYSYTECSVVSEGDSCELILRDGVIIGMLSSSHDTGYWRITLDPAHVVILLSKVDLTANGYYHKRFFKRWDAERWLKHHI